MKKNILNFIWNKRERIKRETVIGKQGNSGLSLVDIELKLKAIKASWVKRLIDESNVNNNIVNSYLNVMKIDLNYLLTLSETKTENFTLISKLPIFYKEIFQTSSLHSSNCGLTICFNTRAKNYVFRIG